MLQFKTSKFFNDTAKVSIKSEKITPFGGIFHVREQFSRFVGPVIDKKGGIDGTIGNPFVDLERKSLVRLLVCKQIDVVFCFF